MSRYILSKDRHAHREYHGHLSNLVLALDMPQNAEGIDREAAAIMADLARLKHNLQVIFQSPERAGADHVVTLQNRYVLALAADVAWFLRRSGVGEDVADKFVALADAIRGLRFGSIADPVRPKTIGGRGPDGLTVWSLRADVVLGMSCLLKSGKFRNQKDGAKYIATNYPAFGRLKRNPDNSLDGSILSWRARIKSGKGPYAVFLAREREFFNGCADLSAGKLFAVGKRVLAEAALAAAI